MFSGIIYKIIENTVEQTWWKDQFVFTKNKEKREAILALSLVGNGRNNAVSEDNVFRFCRYR